MRKIALAVGALLTLAACPEEVPPREPEPRAGSTSVEPSATSTGSPVEAPRCRDLDTLVQRVRRGYVPRRSPDLNLIPREPNYVGAAAAPVHSGPWDYLAKVPLLIYGPGFVRAGTYDLPVTMADLAPTAASLVRSRRFDAPDGAALDEALRKRRPDPRLVVTVVWDGGGWNVLDEHEDAHPFFERLSKRAALFTEMEIGSSPSVTPPIHATLSTGAFPREHGIPALRIRERGGYVDPFIRLDPSRMYEPTLADIYDRETRNRAVAGMLATVNWHLSMIGQGAGTPRGDHDPAVLFDDTGEAFTNTALYSLPDIDDPGLLLRFAAQLDGRDGERDGLWQGHELDEPQVRYASPAHVRYQQVLLERLIEAESFGEDLVPDLLYVNFKPSDDAGHNWGMTSEEVAETLRAQDRALRQLVTFLDRVVGRRRWVVFLTADHGQTPRPRESGGWAIGGGELARDANEVFDGNNNHVPLIDQVSSPGAYVNLSELKANDVTLREIARWIAGYTIEENVKDDSDLAPLYEGRENELVFDAVLVRDQLVVSEACG